MASSKPPKSHVFNVYCGSEKRTLQGKHYESLNDLRNDAFALYGQAGFRDGNAILTYVNETKTEVLLNSIPDASQRNLFIRFVNLGCALCSNPFGIVDDQLIFQCSDVKCAEQYCNSCVQAIRGSPAERPFVCMTCRDKIIPTRNILIEEHIIWNDLCKTYGTQDLLDLKEDSKCNFSHPIRKNVQLRLIHLRSRFTTLQYLLDADHQQGIAQNPNDQKLADDVNQFCIQLENLIERLDRAEDEMESHGTTVETCVKKYKKHMKHFDRLCNTSTENAAKQRPVITTDTTDITVAVRVHNRQNFRMDALNTLSTEQNIPSINRILEDIEFRERCLLGSKQIRSSSSQASSNDHIDELNQKLTKLSEVKDELHYLLNHLKSLKYFVDEYDTLLRDELFPHIPCSKFILLLERMRVRTAEFDISNNFRQTNSLMRTWKNDHGTDDEFKPKVIELCQALEEDLLNLFQDFNWVYSVPYKIGVIGNGSVGKSALVVNLAEVTTYSAMIDFERSTFGYLQFDTRVYKDPDNGRVIPITFVDIEGATDTDNSESAGNYLQLIKKADCDLYIIVFDNLFNEHNKICHEHIVNNLGRQCVFVRSKADVLFNQCFQESYSKKYEKTSSLEYHTKVVLKQIKNHVLKTYADQRLDKVVYLTAAMCEDNVKGACFAEFDLKVLKKKLIQFAKTDVRVERICNLATRSAVGVINTCFRRGYVVSQTKYKWLSAGASIIPFLNELPAFLGREKIRQVFGIHDNSTLTNWSRGTRNSLEEYFMERELTVPKKELNSGEFKYLIAKTTASSEVKPETDTRPKIRKPSDQTQTTNTINRVFENVARPIVAGSAVVVSLADDVASIGLRTVSVVGFTAFMVLSPIFAVWSFYSAGRGMNTELHSICDDLAVILQYFVLNRCEEYCQNIQLPLLELSNKDSSSSDSDND